MAGEKKKSKLEETMDSLNKLYGAGTIMKANEKGLDVEVISTGSIKIDAAIGVGGFPVGRIVEIIGPESSGKTTICLQTIVNAQKQGKRAAFIDMEHALDMNYARKLGVDLDNLFIAQPSFGEEALNIAKMLIESGEFGLVIVDSIAALVPKAEAEGEIGDANVGKQARLMSQSCRILSPLVEDNKTLLIFTNQIRMKIGVMFGSPEVPAGGEAMKFFASVRMDLRKTIDKENQGNKTRVKIIKNKVAAPFGECEIFINWGKGTDRVSEVMDLAVEYDIIKKGGAWYSRGDIKVQGEAAFMKLFDDNPEFYTEIELEVLQTLKKKQNEQVKSESTGNLGERLADAPIKEDEI